MGDRLHAGLLVSNNAVLPAVIVHGMLRGHETDGQNRACLVEAGHLKKLERAEQKLPLRM